MLKLKTIALMLTVLAVPGLATAQEDYPSETIELVVPNPPGGSTDLTTRIVAKALEEKWDTSVRTVNMPGGANFVAVEDVMRAEPDGYKMLTDGLSASSLLGLIKSDMPFKVTDRTFVAYTVKLPMVLVVPADSPIKTLDDVLAALKADPSKVTWTSLGGTGVGDIAFRRLFRQAGVKASQTRAVVSKGGSEAAVQVAGGHVMLGAGSPTAFQSFVQGGQIRVIAAFSDKRSVTYPDAPSTTELGYPELATIQWNGISGPPGLPEAIVRKWYEAVQEMLADPKVIEELQKIGLEPYPAPFGTISADVVAETRDLAVLLGKPVQ